MAKSKESLREIRIQPRIRVLFGKEIAFGPGKADLLEEIRATGSISTAAKNMRLSYMRAWTLIQTMNTCFKKPLVTSARGGSKRGGATLTSFGETVLKLYRKMETDSKAAIKISSSQLAALLDS
jgi:molybdate transport system regulatory protein